jgi:hypothetical protein
MPTNQNPSPAFAVMDMSHAGVVVAILPTHRRAVNTSKKLNAAAGVEYGDVQTGWRYLVTPARLVDASRMFGIPVPAPKISAFNTGRRYTQHGQRIAWCVLPSGNVAMYDLDRMVDYVLAFPPGFDPTEVDVLRAYDTHSYRQDNTAPFATNRADYDAARDLQRALIEAARAAKNVR